MFAQITSIISMNIRSIPQRFWMSLATVVAVAVVVAVLLAFLAMANGFRTTLQGSGSDELAILLRTGSQAEINSVLMREQINVVSESPGIARDEQGPLISPELYLIVDGKKKDSQIKANLPFRGIDERGLELRPNMRIVQGRMFEPGKNEIVVGEAIQREFSGFEVGNTIQLGRAQWQVVGVFSAGGSIFDSELWADVRTVQNQFERGNTVQIVRAKLTTPGDVTAIEETIKSDQRLNLDVKTEKAFYQEQSQGVSDLIFYLGWPLAIAMALGALAGALNTMYNSVAQRSGEIATLRAIGFPGLPVFFGTLFESLVLALLGGLLGAVAAYLFFDGLTTSTLGSSFTQVVFRFDMNADVLLNGVILALVIGFIGGFFPALRAARLPVLLAFAAAA
jgi:ABC-type transport system, involved in lipoprotein release, permease component